MGFLGAAVGADQHTNDHTATFAKPTAHGGIGRGPVVKVRCRAGRLHDLRWCGRSRWRRRRRRRRWCRCRLGGCHRCRCDFRHFCHRGGLCHRDRYGGRPGLWSRLGTHHRFGARLGRWWFGWRWRRRWWHRRGRWGRLGLRWRRRNEFHQNLGRHHHFDRASQQTALQCPQTRAVKQQYRAYDDRVTAQPRHAYGMR